MADVAARGNPTLHDLTPWEAADVGDRAVCRRERRPTGYPVRTPDEIDARSRQIRSGSASSGSWRDNRDLDHASTAGLQRSPCQPHRWHRSRAWCSRWFRWDSLPPPVPTSVSLRLRRRNVHEGARLDELLELRQDLRVVLGHVPRHTHVLYQLPEVTHDDHQVEHVLSVR